MKKYDLNDRLIDYVVKVLRLIDKLEYSDVNKHLGKQLMRSSTSTSLNYGEALGAESDRDFVHKMGLVLKELRESINSLLILQKYGSIDYETDEIDETSQLIAIFTTSIETAKKRINRKK